MKKATMAAVGGFELLFVSRLWYRLHCLKLDFRK